MRETHEKTHYDHLAAGPFEVSTVEVSTVEVSTVEVGPARTQKA